jgi:hypothetical protein
MLTDGIAVADLATHGSEIRQLPIRETRRLLATSMADKGFGEDVVQSLAQRGVLGDLLAEHWLRVTDVQVDNHINQIARYMDVDPSQTSYIGTPKENQMIDLAINRSPNKREDLRKIAGRGASRTFRQNSIFNANALNIADTNIVILGGGPAGLMVARMLVNMRFNPEKMTVIDRTGEYGGIWNMPNVYGGSKNNPFPITYAGVASTLAAPGPGSTIREFLADVQENGNDLPRPIKGVVTRVQTGDLSHAVQYKVGGAEQSIVAPIVINALGVGKPLDPSHAEHMQTTTPDKAGVRWQQQITPEKAESYRDKTIVLIGLGNSTAEMLVQIKGLNERGYNIDFRVLTHFPQEAIDNPDQYVDFEGDKMRVYRDITVADLTRLAGDLPDIREAYDYALRTGRIIAEIKQWESDGKTITYTRSDGISETVPYEQLYTLIGYGHDAETLKALGLKPNQYNKNAPFTDFDGEVQRNTRVEGRDRVAAGYFGLGAILRSPFDRNAIVIPGIQHRMYWMAPSIVMRALEAYRGGR